MNTYRIEHTNAYDPAVLDLDEDDPIVLRSDLWGGSWVAATYVNGYPDLVTAGQVTPIALVVLAGHVRRVGLWRVHQVEGFIPGEYAYRVFGMPHWSGQVMHPLDPEAHDGRRRPKCMWFAACDNEAERVRQGPIGNGRFGLIPICSRCDDKIEALS